jgi:hypothetical protein
MRISNAGNVGIGTSTFNATYPEKLVVDAGTTTSVNAIVGKGSINNYLQLNIQNNSAGTASSSDVVATSNNGDETTNYIDMGINGGSNTTTGIYGGANTAYLYSTGNDFALGNATAGKNLLFFTGGTATANERLRINGSGNVGIATTNPTSTLQLGGSVSYPVVSKSAAYTATATDYTILCTTGSSYSITLPAASGCPGRIYVIKKMSAANTLTIDPNGAETVDGAATLTVTTQYASYTIQSDGSNWVILAKY